MKIIAFISQKGGVGKSTLARVLATEATKKKIKTLLADCDHQQKTNAPARTSQGTLEIAKYADLLIQPVGASRDDLLPALREFNALKAQGISKNKLLFVLNHLSTPAEVLATQEYLTESTYDFAPFYLYERASYRQAQSEGKSISEVNFTSLRQQSKKLTNYLLKKMFGEIPQEISENIKAPETAPSDKRFTGRTKQLNFKLKNRAVEEKCMLVEVLERAFAKYEDLRRKENQSSYRNREVILKVLNNSQNMTVDFLQETTYHKLFDLSDNNQIVLCYGISQDPVTKDYLMVMRYITYGSLRKFLNENYEQLELKDKLRQLLSIVNGLKSIHDKGLVHRDFHTGNILSDEDDSCCITDLGLCRPASEVDQNKIYGVLPYMAPEVLRDKNYTQAADIYSFGIVIYEVLSGLPPYCNLPHDVFLILKIYAEMLQRPTSSEIEKKLVRWRGEIHKKGTELFQQCKEIEEFSRTTQFITQKVFEKVQEVSEQQSQIIHNPPKPI
ncbi:666_t:CDS:2 [Funneliformis geosporum]|nr:666_t:CDS:2 [Funneliformis geosporum]